MKKLESGQNIRFLENTRNAPWRKGDIGVIIDLMAQPLGAQDYIYLVKNKGKVAWCVGAEIEEWNQLSLFTM